MAKSESRSDVLDLVLDDRKDNDSVDVSQNLLQKVVGLLGLPGFILNIFGPQLLAQARRYPRLFRFLGPLILFASSATAFTYLLWPLFNKIVGDWLPFAKLKSDDPLYEYLCRWIHYRKQPFRNLELEAQSARYRRQNRHDHLWWPSDHTGTRDLCFDVGGKRYFWYNRTLFIMEILPNNGRRHYYDTSQDMKLKAVAFSHAPIKEVLQQAWKSYQREEGARKTKIWHYQDDCWEHLAYKTTRPIETVDIDPIEKDKLVKDLTTYLSEHTKLWYSQRGIPYRRGYLFHGPPGTGKTSLSMAIAGYYNLDMYVLSLKNPKLNDSALASLMTQIDTPAVLLLEDIDSAGLTREMSGVVTEKPALVSSENDDAQPDKLGRLTERTEKCNVTLSGVLNALDGAASPEGHILIMSTNAPESLDPALARAGRVDYKVAFRNATYATSKNIFSRMVGDNGVETEKLAHEFASKVPDDRLSLAELQGYLLNHIGDVDTAMKGFDKWISTTLDEKDAAEKKKLEEKSLKSKT